MQRSYRRPFDQQGQRVTGVGNGQLGAGRVPGGNSQRRTCRGTWLLLPRGSGERTRLVHMLPSTWHMFQPGSR